MAKIKKVEKTTEKRAVKSKTVKTATRSPVRRRAPRKVTKPREKTHHTNERWVNFAWVLPLLIVGALVLFTTRKNVVSHPVALTSAKLISLFQRAEAQSVPDRIAFWSENLLKDPYLLSALGSGPAIEDTVPVFPRHYDCTTYVETVGALARSRSGEELADRIISIRYRDNKTTYEARNHFPEADWIPNNEQAGNLKDITVRVARSAGFVASFATKDIDKLAWFKAQATAQRVIATEVENKNVTARVPYLPIDKMEAALEHVPQGAVINVVRESKDRYPVLISHQGFLVWKNGEAYFRHASRNRQITELPFKSYLKTMRDMPWKVIGFNVNTFEG